MTEDKIEQEALKILAEQGWTILHGPDIGPDGSSERQYTDAVLSSKLVHALGRLNPIDSRETIEMTATQIVRSVGSDLFEDNRHFHNLLVNGIDVEARVPGSNEIKTVNMKLFDFDYPENNDFVAVNQLTIIQGDSNRRPDIVLFINGLPLAVLEIKDPTDENAKIDKAYRQLQTYKNEIPSLFRFNELLVITDGLDAEIGSTFADYERFLSWKTIDGQKEAKKTPMMEVLLRGVFDKVRLLDIVRNFIVFEKNNKAGSGYIKKLAAYHQYWAVNKAVDSTLQAIKPDSDHRIGVVWHTQGSGKSLSMVFYTGKIVLEPELKNPTVVVITDRNDLDDQLFGTFANCEELLRQTPVQAESRTHLQTLLRVEAGGVVFTTNAKFFPEDDNDYPTLSERSNIIVVADEAHRSQYNFISGFAKHIRDALPNASFIGFTGTPIEAADRSTPAVFGKYIDVYDIQQAVEDHATVPILYESRLIELDIDKEAREQIDKEFEELTEGEEITKKEQLKTKWAQMGAIIGNTSRIVKVAEDIVKHFELRRSALEGKGMIVCVTRQVAVDLYNAIIELRPEWYSKEDNEGFLKLVMTGGATDLVEWQQHIRNKERRQRLAERMRDSNSDLKLVIVCDMWLTGFDVPSLHTMYIDKPMKGHNLMQAIARVNRVWGDKPGGLIVDYLGVATALREALQDYTSSNGKGKPTLDQNQAVTFMIEKYEIIKQMLHGLNWKPYFSGNTTKQMQTILDAQDFILGLDDGEKRFRDGVLALSKAYALAVPHQKALAISDDVGFFQDVKARLGKLSSYHSSDEDYGLAIRQIVDKAIAPSGILDIFSATGIEKPELSILSDEFLAEIKDMDRQNLAVEALQKLLKDEVKARFASNALKARSFGEMIETALTKYRNHTIEAAQVVEELIAVAKEIRDSGKEAKELGLTPDEVAFYDALVSNASARDVMGDGQLRKLAALLVKRVRANITVDWTLREDAQARLRIEVKRLLKEYGYPPDETKLATELVLEQASLFGDELSE
jgi:type I restriction enzyme R subunit